MMVILIEYCTNVELRYGNNNAVLLDMVITSKIEPAKPVTSEVIGREKD